MEYLDFYFENNIYLDERSGVLGANFAALRALLSGLARRERLLKKKAANLDGLLVTGVPFVPGGPPPDPRRHAFSYEVSEIK